MYYLLQEPYKGTIISACGSVLTNLIFIVLYISPQAIQSLISMNVNHTGSVKF